MSKGASRFYSFHPFRVDAVKRLLLRDGIPIPLTPKAFDTLLTLIRNRGRIIPKDELLKNIWPDTFVEEATLAQNVFTLRKALGGSEGDQYIQTIPKRGYRFVANVTEEMDAGTTVSVDQSGLGSERIQQNEPATRDRAISSVAVLPLINASDDPNYEHLSDSITESIVNSLSLAPELRIKACSTVVKYKGRELDPQDAGRELAVDSVLIGRLIPFGPNLLIRMELVEVSNGWQIWGEEYSQELSGLDNLPQEMAKDIAEKLREKLIGEDWQRLLKGREQKSDAHQFYLKGRYFSNLRTTEGSQKAIDCFETAIEIDPRLALAYSGLADSYIKYDFYGLRSLWKTIPKARAAAVKALELDNQLAEAHTSVGAVKLVYDRDFVGAERELKHAIRLNPKYSRAHDWYAHCLRELGQIEESLAECRLALELDPFDLEINHHLGWHYLKERQYEPAIEQLQKTLSMGPNFYRPRILLGVAYERKKLFSQAIDEFLRAQSLERSAVLSGFLGHTYAIAGNSIEALTILDGLLAESQHSYVPPFCVAIIYAGLGRQDEALDWLQKAFIEQSQWRTWLSLTPELDSLRAHPRFIEMVEHRYARGDA